MATDTNIPAGETPVAGDLRTAAELAKTSHLDNVTLPGQADDGDPDDVQGGAPDIKLPRTLKESLALLAEGQAVAPENAGEAKVIAGQLEKLRAHIHTLSQGPTCKPISSETHTNLSRSSSSHAKEIHLTLLARSDRFVAELIADLAAAEKKISDLTEKKN